MMRATVVGMSLITTAALAQPVLDRGPNNDPNQVVCVKEKESGSRLTTRRVCRTRAQWVEYRSQIRHVYERAQAFADAR